VHPAPAAARRNRPALRHDRGSAAGGTACAPCHRSGRDATCPCRAGPARRRAGPGGCRLSRKGRVPRKSRVPRRPRAPRKPRVPRQAHPPQAAADVRRPDRSSAPRGSPAVRPGPACAKARPGCPASSARRCAAPVGARSHRACFVI
jgi:hypothetical protein